MDNKQIANTIWEQMRALDTNLCMCMGVQGLTVIDRGLQFQVNGLSFKGFVKITLNGADLYDVSLVKLTRKLNKELQASHGIKKFNVTEEVVKSFDDVYAEDLMSLLESEVENREGSST
jgi:hypothetical protein